MLKNIISRVNVICGNRAALKCLFAVLLITTGVGTASAYDFKTGGLCYNILSNQDKTVEVTYYYYSSDYYDRFNSYDSDKLDAYGLSGYKGDPVIPEKVNYNGKNYTVVAIGDHAFESCYDLTSVKIPYRRDRGHSDRGKGGANIKRAAPYLRDQGHFDRGKGSAISKRTAPYRRDQRHFDRCQ